MRPDYICTQFRYIPLLAMTLAEQESKVKRSIVCLREEKEDLFPGQGFTVLYLEP